MCDNLIFVLSILILIILLSLCCFSIDLPHLLFSRPIPVPGSVLKRGCQRPGRRRTQFLSSSKSICCAHHAVEDYKVWVHLGRKMRSVLAAFRSDRNGGLVLVYSDGHIWHCITNNIDVYCALTQKNIFRRIYDKLIDRRIH